MTNTHMSGFDNIVTPQEWKAAVLSNTTKKKYSHFRLRTVFALVLVVVIVFAAAVTAFAAASPQFREWLLSIINVTESVTEVNGAKNIVRTQNFGNEYLVEDGFIITNEGTPEQQVFEYADGNIRNSDIKTFEGTYDSGNKEFKFSFEYAKNGLHLYTYDYKGDIDFTVGNMNTNDDIAAVYFNSPADSALVVVELSSNRILREINIPDKLKDFAFSNKGTYALFKITTQEEGIFEWYVTNMQTGLCEYIEMDGAPYSGYFYDDSQIIFMSYGEEEEMYLPALYNIKDDSLIMLKGISAEYTADNSFPYTSRLEDGEYTFRNIVDEKTVKFDVNKMFSQDDITATFSQDRFFFCDYGEGSMAIFDLENEIMTSIKAEDFQSDYMLFVSLLDKNTLLVCGEKAGIESPAFYLMQLEK